MMNNRYHELFVTWLGNRAISDWWVGNSGIGFKLSSGLGGFISFKGLDEYAGGEAERTIIRKWVDETLLPAIRDKGNKAGYNTITNYDLWENQVEKTVKELIDE
jgi:hypothetical protein